MRQGSLMGILKNPVPEAEVKPAPAPVDMEEMSRLEALIAELCPDGVEYKTLGEIAVDIFRGSGITREQIRETGTPCVKYGEIYTAFNVWFSECVSHTDEKIIKNKKFFEYGDVLFAITCEKVEKIAKYCVYIGNDRCLAGGDIVVLKHNQNHKYIGYVLSTTFSQNQKSKGKIKSKVVHSSVPSIKEIKIPVPPLQVQEEIVRILDTFSEFTVELTKRKQQYQYYSKQIILNSHSNKSVHLCYLGALSGCKTPSMAKEDYWNDGYIPFVSSKASQTFFPI